MEPVKWSNLPEMHLKKDEPAKYQGILVPELNYKNYKTFEAVTPQVEKLASVQVVEAQSESFFHAVLWFIVGAAVGALVVQIK